MSMDASWAAGAAAIDDARALLDSLIASQWRDLHVVSGATEVFIAKPGGRANPMRDTAEPASHPSATRREIVHVRAPHVASLVDVVAVGTRVAAGERVATLRVLTDEQDLVAPSTGTVVVHSASPGSLLDYDESVVTLERAA